MSIVAATVKNTVDDEDDSDVFKSFSREESK